MSSSWFDGIGRAPPRGPAMTLDEWANMDEDEDGELVDGYLVEEEVNGSVHELIVSWLIIAVGPWLNQRGGRIFGSGLKFRIDDRRGRKPDVSIDLSRALRISDAPLQSRIPDIAVEIVSPGPRNERRDRVEKMTDYARAGFRWYWIIDPALGSFEIFALTERGRYERVLAATDGLIEEIPGCPELSLNLDSLWSEIDEGLRE